MYRCQRKLDAKRLARLQEDYHQDPIYIGSKKKPSKQPSKRKLKREKMKKEKQLVLQKGKDGS